MNLKNSFQARGAGRHVILRRGQLPGERLRGRHPRIGRTLPERAVHRRRNAGRLSLLPELLIDFFWQQVALHGPPHRPLKVARCS